MSYYTYKPLIDSHESFQKRATTDDKFRFPNNIYFAVMDPTNTLPSKPIFSPNTVLNYDHLNNPYNRDVNPNFYTLPYCPGYYTQEEPKDHFGRPISTTYYALNSQKKI